jgi:hypothetical protein
VDILEANDFRGVPWSQYKSKVLERADEDFIALAEVLPSTLGVSGQAERRASRLDVGTRRHDGAMGEYIARGFCHVVPIDP